MSKRVGGFPRLWKNLAKKTQRSLALQEVNRGNQAGEVLPGVGMQAAASAQVLHELCINDPELQAELVPHLVAPLNLKRCRTDDEDLSRAVTQDQLQDNQAGFDGLSQAYIVGNQQADPGHLDCAYDRIKLVVFDFDAATEGRLDGSDISG